MDFIGNDIIDIDCSKVFWLISEVELNKFWDVKVKYDQFNLKLIGKMDKEIKEMLMKCYQVVIKCLM